jgi:hypothetical protein
MKGNSVDVGDLIDDYCPRCRLLLSHDIAAVVEGEVKKVRCRTCLNEHPYRHGKGGRKEKDDIKSLWDQVLSKMPKPPKKQ